MYESCFADVNNVLVVVVLLLVVFAGGLACAVERQTRSARYWREHYRHAANDARIFKRERDQAKAQYLFPPGRMELNG